MQNIIKGKTSNDCA